MHAGSASNIRQSSQAIAESLKLPGWNDPQVDVVRALHTWLQDDRNDQWLLIIDNADDLSVLDEPFTSGNGPKTLFELLPRRKSGIILVTTRDRRVGERLAVRGHTIAVPAMSLSEGKQLLSTYLDSTVTYTLAEASQLLLALDFLPLAITQAAAYITENFVSLQDYLALLSKGDEDTETLLTESLSDIRRDDPDSNSVVKTWKLSFDQIRERDWRAADILSLMAMFDRQSLQVELFMREQESKIGLDKSLATLLNFSFISRTADGDAYRMHSLVRAAIQAWLRLQGTLPDWQQSALSVLAKIFPSGEYENWSRCEAYLPHAMIILQYEPDSPHSCLERAVLLERIAMYDKEQYRFRPALGKSKEAAQIFQRFVGSEDPRTLSCSVTAANCLIHLFQLREAEQILEATTTTMRREYSELAFVFQLSLLPFLLSQFSFHFCVLAVLRALSGLAVTRRLQLNAYLISSMLITRLLTGVLGSQHRETARSMRYQGWVRYLSRKYRKAEDLLYTTMKHQEIELGPTDEETLNTMLFLATVLCKLGKQKQQQARVLFQKVLAAREAKFGPSHPNTIDTYCRLAICLNSLGEHSKAEALHRRALALRAKVFGIESEFAIAQMHNLAVCLFQQHNADKALAIYQACLALRIKVLGQDDARTFLSRANMIQTLVYLGYIKEAVGQSELIVASRDELMESQHPSAIWTIRKAEQCLQKFSSPLISLEDTEIGSLLLSGSG